ncbi:MAG: hypothetical protein IPK96_08520 [Flammeovirgaceae bacterium]|nr:hypothetical protein [Flammeovirgaceae bacterium]
MKAVFTGFLLIVFAQASAQNVEAFGIFGGFNFPFTVDQGLSKDPRFYGKLTIRSTPDWILLWIRPRWSWNLIDS